MKRNLTIGLAIFGFIALLGLIFVFSGKKPATQEVKKFPAAESQTQKGADSNESWATSYKLQATSSLFSSIFQQTILDQNRKTFKEIGAQFEKFKPAVKNFLPESAKTLFPPQTEFGAADEKEIFAKLYPDYFTAGLITTQNFFLEQGWLDGNYQKIENFDSEEKIFSFTNTVIEVFEKQGVYSKDEAEKFRKGINQTWKDLMKKEKSALLGKTVKSDFYKKMFSNILKIVKVYASPDCYKSGPVLPGGSNVWAPCCNCGYKILPDGQKQFVSDCGGRVGGEDLGGAIAGALGGAISSPQAGDLIQTVIGGKLVNIPATEGILNQLQPGGFFTGDFADILDTALEGKTITGSDVGDILNQVNPEGVSADNFGKMLDTLLPQKVLLKPKNYFLPQAHAQAQIQGLNEAQLNMVRNTLTQVRGDIAFVETKIKVVDVARQIFPGGKIPGGAVGGIINELANNIAGVVISPEKLAGLISNAVPGLISGNVIGTVLGNFFPSGIAGDMLGNIMGSLSSFIPGDVFGGILESVIPGGFPGDVLGGVLENVFPGDVVGDVLGGLGDTVGSLGGILGGECQIPLGCLNLYGKNRPVIWDEASGICGVG